jgi:DNA (cytosine-5)-methyltransferase 1
VSELKVVEICAGAGGQSLGLELAGFDHELAVELDANACKTLRHNRRDWNVAEGDVASLSTWDPAEHIGVDLLAGGVPCPPFTIAGKQLGATDERDLFAWAALELCEVIKPRALLLENVRGLSMNRFAAYRQRVLDGLNALGYVGDWKLLNASDYGVSQLRPRFVLVAMQPDHFAYFEWPEPQGNPQTVGDLLYDLMSADGWPGADAWREKASKIAPTIVGGSKKHGGADLGPTRAKAAWREMGVDALGIADHPPTSNDPADLLPKLTTKMVERIQGWVGARYRWEFQGRKTSVYRQIGNAFPPPVAEAVGGAIRDALIQKGDPRRLVEDVKPVHDPIYRVLQGRHRFMGLEQISKELGRPIDPGELDRHINLLKRDFDVEIEQRKSGPAYRLGEFKAFLGQEDHGRHEAFQLSLTKIS